MIENEVTTRVCEDAEWDLIIRPKRGWFDLRFGELWRYRDLVFLFVKRDFVAFYQQTILGPVWLVIQPLFNTFVFTVVFGIFAKMPTDSTPPFLFYLSGNVVWMYFASCLTGTSNTFVMNANIFGKVYFPRLVVPVGTILTNFFQFGIQFSLFLILYITFIIKGASVHPTLWILMVPVLLFQMALLGLGAGTLVSSLTTRYRDLALAMGFGVQLWMYATPVVYPISQVPARFRMLYSLNPMASVVELFRLGFLGQSSIETIHIILGWVVTLLLLFLGIVLFHKVEKSFMDTV